MTALEALYALAIFAGAIYGYLTSLRTLQRSFFLPAVLAFVAASLLLLAFTVVVIIATDAVPPGSPLARYLS